MRPERCKDGRSDQVLVREAPFLSFQKQTGLNATQHLESGTSSRLKIQDFLIHNHSCLQDMYLKSEKTGTCLALKHIIRAGP